MIDSTLFETLQPIAFWVTLASVWLYITIGIYLENKMIREKSPSLPTMQYVLARLSGLQRRNLQLWALASMLLAVCCYNGLSPVLHMQPPPKATLANTAEQAEAKAKAQAEIKELKMQAERKMAAEAVKAMDEPVKNPVPAANPLPFSDITEFNEKDSKQQAFLDWLKQRYENWLITYYYLQKCGMADKNDFDLIRSSLHKELTDLHTETALVEDNILLAANGSYNELYASASCDDERVKATKSSYDEYMRPMRQPAVKTAPQGGHISIIEAKPH